MFRCRGYSDPARSPGPSARIYGGGHRRASAGFRHGGRPERHTHNARRQRGASPSSSAGDEAFADRVLSTGFWVDFALEEEGGRGLPREARRDGRFAHGGRRSRRRRSWAARRAGRGDDPAFPIADEGRTTYSGDPRRTTYRGPAAEKAESSAGRSARNRGRRRETPARLGLSGPFCGADSWLAPLRAGKCRRPPRGDARPAAQGLSAEV